jgi:hypothetical protein
VLLKRCVSDNDDVVRDRATMYLELLEDTANAVAVCAELPKKVPLRSLEYSIQEYLQDDDAVAAAPFDIDLNYIELADDEATRAAEAEAVRLAAHIFVSDVFKVLSTCLRGGLAINDVINVHTCKFMLTHTHLASHIIIIITLSGGH